MQLCVATKFKTFNATEIDTIPMMLQGDNKPKSTLKGVAIALLYSGLLRGFKVAMTKVEDVNINTVGSQNQIEITFLHNCKQRNEGFQFFIPSKVCKGD